MKLKHINYKATTLNRFDLLGSDEVGLSKAFAYLISVEPTILYRFLRDIGISIKQTESNYLKTTIEIERSRKEGRTDIEIKQHGKYHVIIECKVGKNRIKKQRKQYLPSFDNEPKKVLCFITQEHDCNREVANETDIFYRGWLDIIDLVDSKEFDRSDIIKEFVGYATRGFKMRDQKEVLIQDLSDPIEIDRYINFGVYRRDVTFGSPLYFAPYFTRNADRQEGEGVCYLSKVLGVMTVRPEEILSFEDELIAYSNDDHKQVLRWLEGVKKDSTSNPFTYYFLADPVKLNKPLLKDGGNKKGRGKGWVAAMIPKNRCVTFEEFTRRMVIANNS